MRKVLEFYQGDGETDEGYMLDDILKWPDYRLQVRTEYFSWVFPIQTGNSLYYKLSIQPEFSATCKKVFDRFLNFYGFSYKNRKLTQIKPVKRQEEGAIIGLYNTDTLDRLSRILQFFSGTRMTELSAVFFLMLCNVMKKFPDFRDMIAGTPELDRWILSQPYLPYEKAKRALLGREEKVEEVFVETPRVVVPKPETPRVVVPKPETPRVVVPKPETPRVTPPKPQISSLPEQPLDAGRESFEDVVMLAQAFSQSQNLKIAQKEIDTFKKANPGIELEGNTIEEQYKFLQEMLKAEEDIELDLFLEKERREKQERQEEEKRLAREAAMKSGYVGGKQKGKHKPEKGLTDVPVFEYTRKDISRALDQVSAYGGMSDLQGKQESLLSMSKGEIGNINLEKFVQLKNPDRNMYMY